MALARLFRGKSADFTTEKVPLHDGYMYVLLDNHTMWMDAVVDGTLKRIPIAADPAQIDAVLEEAKDYVDDHKTAINPHGITPELIGAVTVVSQVEEPVDASDGTMWINPQGEGPGGGSGGGSVEVDDALSTTSINPVQNKVITAALNEKANSSHGYHVPTPEGANGAKFLRNDNTWQTVTPDNIGAMAAVFYAGTSAPSNTKLLWIDTTASTGGLKYHNGSGWVHVPVAYT